MCDHLVLFNQHHQHPQNKWAYQNSITLLHLDNSHSRQQHENLDSSISGNQSSYTIFKVSHIALGKQISKTAWDSLSDNEASIIYPNSRVHTENSNQLMEINLLCFDPVHRWDQSSTAEVVVCFDRNKDPFPFVFHKPPIYSKHSLAHTVNSSTISIVIYFTSNHFNMWLHNIQNDLHKQNNKSSGLISTWLWQLRRWNFICIGIKSKPIHNMKDDIIIQTLPKKPW